MPVTIKTPQVAQALRLVTDPTQLQTSISEVLDGILEAATAIVEIHAPAAPDPVLNQAAIRVCGYIYESDPTQSARGRENPLRTSGAAALLSQWRVHRAAALEDGDASDTPVTPASGLPPAPTSGNFILTVNNGELAWIAFPQP